jgi:hypothetical protein
MMDSKIIKTILHSLTDMSFMPHNEQKYRPVSETDLQMLHRERIVQNGRTAIEEDLLEPALTPLQAAEENRAGGFYVLRPDYLDYLDVSTITQAFYTATLTASYPEQKTIQGLVLPNHLDLFAVQTWTRTWIDDAIKRMDAEMPRTDHAIPSRMQCVAIERMSDVSNGERQMVFGAPMDPRRTDAQRVYDNLIKMREGAFYEVTDWDKESAQRQYMKCGLPIVDKNNIPIIQKRICTEFNIRKAYDAYMEKHKDEEQQVNEIDYPRDIIDARKTTQEKHEVNSNYIRRGLGMFQAMEQDGVSATPDYLKDSLRKPRRQPFRRAVIVQERAHPPLDEEDTRSPPEPQHQVGRISHGSAVLKTVHHFQNQTNTYE